MRHPIPRHDDSIVAIYDAALAPERWPTVIGNLSHLVDSDTFHLQAWDRTENCDRLGVSDPAQVSALAAYQAHFGRLDPRRALAAQLTPGSVAACHRHFDERYVRTSEFYQDYLIPQVGRYSASISLARHNGLDIHLDIVRPRNRQPFGDEELGILAGFVPHLRQACALMLEIGSLREQLRTTQAMLDVSNLGIVATSASGRVRHTNRRGEAFLRAETWLRQEKGELHAMESQGDSALYAAFRKATSRRTATNVDLGRGQGESRCCVTVLPLSECDSAAALIPGQADLLCLVTESGRSRVANIYQLMELFALSPAEARLARALTHGDSLAAFADAQGIKMTTVKTQLQNVLRKTETASQKDLIRLILSLPAVR